MTAAKMHFLETTQSIMHNIVCIIVAQWPGNFKNSGSDLVPLISTKAKINSF